MDDYGKKGFSGANKKRMIVTIENQEPPLLLDTARSLQDATVILFAIALGIFVGLLCALFTLQTAIGAANPLDRLHMKRYSFNRNHALLRLVMFEV